jgi:hypothetical protein
MLASETAVSEGCSGSEEVNSEKAVLIGSSWRVSRDLPAGAIGCVEIGADTGVTPVVSWVVSWVAEVIAAVLPLWLLLALVLGSAWAWAWAWEWAWLLVWFCL